MSDTPVSLLDRLHDPEHFAGLDPQNMLGLVRKFPDQCREAAKIRWQYGPGHTDKRDIRQVVVTGLGGSAIGGDFARSMMEAFGTVPLVVNRDYNLPHWVGPHTLVIAGSYSGNTEETLAAYRAAQNVNAQIAVVSSGGELSKMAREDGNPIAVVPGGQPPRSATGYMFFPRCVFSFRAACWKTKPTKPIWILRRTLKKRCIRLTKMETELGPDVPDEIESRETNGAGAVRKNPGDLWFERLARRGRDALERDSLTKTPKSPRSPTSSRNRTITKF